MKHGWGVEIWHGHEWRCMLICATAPILECGLMTCLSRHSLGMIPNNSSMHALFQTLTRPGRVSAWSSEPARQLHSICCHQFAMQPSTEGDAIRLCSFLPPFFYPFAFGSLPISIIWRKGVPHTPFPLSSFPFFIHQCISAPSSSTPWLQSHSMRSTQSTSMCPQETSDAFLRF